MTLRFSKEIYNKTVLLKAAYTFIDKAYIHLDCDEKDFIVSIESKSNNPSDLILDKEFVNEILIQAVRHDIYIETKTIREMLVARAIASSVVEMPPKEDEQLEKTVFNESTILNNWFNKCD